MTLETSTLLERAKDNLLAARKLHAGDYPDFAVLHACDVIFLIAMAMLQQAGVMGARHPFLSRMLSEVLVKPGRVSGEYQRYLLEAESARRLADDNLSDTLTHDDAVRYITNASNFLKLAETHFNEQTSAD